MSYRTYVNGTQVFGNNECYQQWLDYLKSKGITVNDEGCYDGYLDDFMESLEVIESIVMDLEARRKARYNKLVKSFDRNSSGMSCKEMVDHLEIMAGSRSLFDFSNIPVNVSMQKDMLVYGECNAYRASLFDGLHDAIQDAYAVMPVAFYNACLPMLEQEKPYSRPGHLYCYKLKPGQRIHVKAS